MIAYYPLEDDVPPPPNVPVPVPVTIETPQNSLSKFFDGEINEWLKLTGYAGDTSEEERQLRCKSFDTLMGIPDYLSAQKILKRIKNW